MLVHFPSLSMAALAWGAWLALCAQAAAPTPSPEPASSKEAPPSGALGLVRGPRELFGGWLSEIWQAKAGERRAAELRRKLGPRRVEQHLLRDRSALVGDGGEHVVLVEVRYLPAAQRGGKAGA